MMTVAVIGAGMAGLTCGRMLQAAGYEVTWFEKSRGVGGRLATRRLASGGWVDHGVRYWVDQGGGLQTLTQELLTQGILHEWPAKGFFWAGGLQPKPGMVYCGDRGVNAIAKHLAHGCDIRRQHRVNALAKTASGWQLIADSPDGPIKFQADAVVLAIPAPQVLPLLQPLGAAEGLASVEYAPCLSLMATYETLPEVLLLDHGLGWHISADHSVLSWLSLDSSKCLNRLADPIVLLQSQAGFADQYLRRLDTLVPDRVAMEALLNETAAQMLTAAATIVPGLDQPQNHRLHRWRYSVVSQPHRDTLFKTQWSSLVCCGDWCTTDDTTNLEAAHRSGRAAAALIKTAVS